MKSLRQQGIGHIVALVVVLVIAIAGFTGYKVFQANNDNAKAPAGTALQEQAASSTELTAADNELDQSNQELNQNLDTSELDKDLDAML